jgi:replicative DNA helicase
MARENKPIDVAAVWQESGNDDDIMETALNAIAMPTIPLIIDDKIERLKDYARYNRIVARVMDFMLADHEAVVMDLEKLVEDCKADVPKVLDQDTAQFVSGLTTPLTNNRIETGFKKLDYTLGWLPKRHVSLIAARPAVGKTTFALNIGTKQKRAGKNVMVFSLEMGIEQINERVAAMMSAVPYGVIHDHRLDESQLHNVTQAMALFDNYKGRFLVLDDVYAVDNIINMIAAERPDIVFVDFVQFIGCNEGRNTNERIGYIMKAFKRAAKAYDCHICILSQLNRQADTDGEPSMRHLRDSGELEQYADIIIFLHRPGILSETVPLSETYIIVAKNKFGKTGRIKATFIGEQQRFREE